MNTFFSTLFVAATISSSALAGSPAPYSEAPVVPVAASQSTDWSGFYAGGLVSFDSGELGYGSPGSTIPFVYDFEKNTSFGGFAGYNLQRGALVYGGELAYNSAGSHVAPFDNEAQSFVLDAKARVGFAAGHALIYGVVGYSMTEWTTSTSYSASGLSYGLGLDYMIGEHLFVGAEYLVRDMSGPREDNPNFVGHTALSSAALRAGWKF
ncbi:MAG: porin family protein [Rhodobacteraceae bacterium]|nr:porin family protein [Paracoccaceae bacterium]